MINAMPERPDEAALNELVWANNPELGTPVKQMTRGKLRILHPSGYREIKAEAAPAPAPPPATRTSARRSGDTEQKQEG